MSDYPVGATWEGEEIDRPGIANQHRIAVIWLDERRGDLEIWYWEWTHSDGSRPWHSRDWCTSYRGCKEELPFNCRMKRVK